MTLYPVRGGAARCKLLAMMQCPGRRQRARPRTCRLAWLFILCLLVIISPVDAAPLRFRPEKVHKNAPPLEAAAHQFGFVCGVHFSGTSILHYALGLHPEVSIMHTAALRMDEGQGFQDVVPTAEDLGSAYLARLHAARQEAAAGVSAVQYPRAREVGRYFALDQAGRLDSSAPELSNATRLRSQWQVLWDTRRRVLVEKSPPDLIRMRFLGAVFPPAWFVVIVRHPLAVCRRVEWHMRLLCVHNWLNAYEWGIQDIDAGKLNAYVVFYERWAAHPVQELTAMTAITGLDRSAVAHICPGKAFL